MSGWAPGDLALCVKLTPWRQLWTDGTYTSSVGPRPGEVCTVAGLALNEVGLLGLFLDEYPDHSFGTQYRASSFRKIEPHTPDAEDRETIALLNGVPVDA